MFKMERDIAVVYLVAGMSSRFGGKIKQFARVGPNDETLIEYSVNQALAAGFNKIIFIVGDKTEQEFKEMFGDSYRGVLVFYAKQEIDSETRIKPWGTVDALCCAKELIDCPFVVCNGDDIYGENSFKILIKHIQDNQGSATIGFNLRDVLSDSGKVNRGIFEIDSNRNVTDLREIFGIKKTNLKEKGLSPDDLCSTNFFAMHPNIIEILNLELKLFKEKNKNNYNAECLLPEELPKFIKKGLMTMKVYFTPDKWLGITNPEDEIVVRKIISEQSA